MENYCETHFTVRSDAVGCNREIRLYESNIKRKRYKEMYKTAVATHKSGTSTE